MKVGNPNWIRSGCKNNVVLKLNLNYIADYYPYGKTLIELTNLTFI